MKMSRLFLFVLALTGSLSLSAQTIPVNTKFGEVSKAELEMTVYEPDTSAVALILYRDTEIRIGFEIDSEGALAITNTTRVRERVKILKESGKSYPSYAVTYDVSETPSEKVSGIKAVTYNLEGGKIVQSKLAKKMMFDDLLTKDTRIVKFAPENVQVGSVVEIEYTKLTNGATIGRIPLQGEHPVNYEKVDVSYADYFTYNHLVKGFYPVDFKSSSQAVRTPLRGGLTMDTNVIDDIYIATDIPAMKETSFSFSPSQYLSGVEYDITAFIIPGVTHQTLNQSWGYVDNLFMKEGLFKELSAKLKFKDEAVAAAAAVQPGEDRELEIISAVRKVVLSKVRSDETTSVFPDATTALKEGKGSSADINAVMASALDACGFKAEPVLVRPRTKGTFISYQITPRAFSALILKVTTPSGHEYYLDASDDSGYVNVLDTNYLVEQARLLHADGRGEWVDLSDLNKSRATETINMTVSPSGEVTGKVAVSTTDEFAYNAKEDYDSYKTEDEYIEDMEEDTGVSITSLEVAGPGEWSREFILKYEFETEAARAGDLLYVRPFIEKFHSESSFREQERIIPVDFPFSENINLICRVTIPEGYAVEQLPSTVVLKSNAAGSQVICQSQAVGGDVVVSYRFSRTKNLVLASDYAELRAYWEQLCNIYNSTIVFKKEQ